jgi:pimeloyl-ACP methyl ester carboxylesterase
LTPTTRLGQHPGVDVADHAGEHRVDVGSVTLCYELLGDPGDPVVLLIAGLGRSLLGWDDDFCGRLIGEGLRVLRFDNRDAGLSTSIEAGRVFDLAAARRDGRGAVAYTLDDMADDAAGLLRALGITDAHVVGTSMGGMIAQMLAVRHPAMVRSLCSIMSTTGAAGVGEPTAEALAVVMQRPPTDRASYVATELANQRVIGSRRDLVDEAWRRGRFERLFDRGLNPRGTGRQIMAIVASGDRTAALGSISAPTVVIHGDADTLVPLSGGQATARAIPGAQLVVLPDMGHEIPPRAWAAVTGAILANANRAGGRTLPPTNASASRQAEVPW